MSLLVAPKPKRIPSPRTIWQEVTEAENRENKGESDLGWFVEDASLEVKRILFCDDCEDEHYEIPFQRPPSRRPDSVAEQTPPLRYASPPARSQNPHAAAAEEYWGAEEEFGLNDEEPPPYGIDQMRSPPSAWCDEDPEDEFHQYQCTPPEDDTDALPALAFSGDFLCEDFEQADGFVLQIATAPCTPSFKRKRGELISRSLPDIRFPSLFRRSPCKNDSNSPNKNTSQPIAIQVSSSHPRSIPHRRCHSQLAGLLEIVTDRNRSKALSPFQQMRYRHTVS